MSSAADVKLVTLTEKNLDQIQMFCGHSPTYRQGYTAKREWARLRLREGLRYTILQVHGWNAGLIEYLPAEQSWRGVNAPGYLLIHCFWVIGQNRRHGYGRVLLQACLENAQGTNGVAVVVSKTHWLPTPKLFLKNGFELADKAAPSFELLVKRLNPQAPLPRFKKNSTAMPDGLVLYTSAQCPYFQNAVPVAEQVGVQLGLPVHIVRMEDARAAQASPCLYGTLGYFYNGKLLSYCPLGSEKLMELIRLETAGQTH